MLGHLITKSIMSVPAAILFAHVMLPENNDSSQTLQQPPRIYDSAMDSITRGTSDGLNIYLNILAILIVLIAFVALGNGIIGCLPDVGGSALTLERIAGWIFAPIAWLMGIPWSEALTAGSLLGIKSVLNEFIALSAARRDFAGSLVRSQPPDHHLRPRRLRQPLQHRHPDQRHRCDGAGAPRRSREPRAARVRRPRRWPRCMCGCIVGLVAG